MTIGIYAIYWEQDDSRVYIGQSINIKRRQKWHLDSLIDGTHYNYKLIDAYNLWGTPVFYTVQECEESELDDLEIIWIEEFNSIHKGYNITSGGVSGRGLNHSQSKYSKFTLLRVFSLLYSTILPYKRVAELARVNIYLVHNIAAGNSHLWLKSEYPEKFQLMLTNRSIRNKTNVRSLASRNITHKPLVSPTGETFNNITNIAAFCRSHPLLSVECDSIRSSIAKVLKGTKLSHKGWHLQT